MKKYIPVILAIMLFLCIISAGCLSFNATTADIVVGDQKVGTVTVTPQNDKLFTDSSLSEKFNVELEAFGVKYSKEGLTLSEKNELLSSISMGNLENINLDGFKTETTSTESFLDSLVNMKLSADDETTLSEALGNAGKTFSERLAAFEKLFQS